MLYIKKQLLWLLSLLLFQSNVFSFSKRYLFSGIFCGGIASYYLYKKKNLLDFLSTENQKEKIYSKILKSEVERLIQECSSLHKKLLDQSVGVHQDQEDLKFNFAKTLLKQEEAAFSLLCNLESISEEVQKVEQIIIVPGILSSGGSWFKAGGDFFEALRDSARSKLGSSINIDFVDWDRSVSNVPMNKSNLLKGVLDLCKKIVATKGKVVTIGHSTGGLIISAATQILECLGKNYSEMESEKLLKNLCSEMNKFHIPGYGSIKVTLGDLSGIVKNVKQSVTGSLELDKKIFADFVLASPVKELYFLPSDFIVKKVFCISHTKDPVLNLFGYSGMWEGYHYDAEIIPILAKLDPSATDYFTLAYHSFVHGSEIGNTILNLLNLSPLYKRLGGKLSVNVSDGAHWKCTF